MNNNTNIYSDNTTELNEIKIKGAREHNLKNVDVTIPRDKFIVITGLSGSGKSTLAFDTLYAEGQRRYVDCMSPYSKQFMGMLKKPEVDSIEGLSPAISIEQKSISHNPRSTVGTVTEIYDYLRLLFAKIGIQYSLDSGLPVIQKSMDQICEEIMEKFDDQKVQILTPLIRARKGHYRELFEKLLRQGFTKVRVDRELRDITPSMQLVRFKTHDIDLVIDRLHITEKNEHRIRESIDLALNKGDGYMKLIARNEDTGVEKEELFSTRYSDPVTGRAYQPLAPNMFSFNSPYGACPRCNGLGEVTDFNLSMVLPDDTISIAEGAIVPLGVRQKSWLWAQTEIFAEKNNIDLTIPLKDLSKEDLRKILYNKYDDTFSTERSILKLDEESARGYTFEGILPGLIHLMDNSVTAVKKELEMYLQSVPCPKCNGGRLREESLAVRILDYNINDIVTLDIVACIERIVSMEKRLTKRQLKVAGVILREIKSRLKFLMDVGLSYLSISRSIRTLSGGESQRIRLASQIGSQLVGIMYVLDEPSIGLHQHDNDKLIHSLKELRDLGNTVIVVEHDKAMIEQSDYLVDIGPGSGVHGGEIMLSGITSEILALPDEAIKDSLTALYLRNLKSIPVPSERRQGNGENLILYGAKGNNLQSIDLILPLGKLICITGMSGSGKSSVISDTLYPILANHLYRSGKSPLPYDRIEGMEHIDKLIEIDQSPIGRTPRSNPATYTGLFTLIRDFYAILPESKVRGYKPGRFSFNVEGGRCEECQGAGMRKIEMNFLPDVYVKCEACNGRRYNKETLQVLYKGKSISDVLEMTVEEALEFFSEHPKTRKKIKTLFDVGLTYIKLGQQAPTLSGGEAQRVKLAAELSKRQTGKTLYLLDEPTTGLHFEDIRILLKLLAKLSDKGNTVVVIEHNLDVIKYADWIIDMGPMGGNDGGLIIAQGTPEDLIKVENSYTAMYLKKEMGTICNC